MKSRQTTLKDIARILNVSPSTVSRALKDSHEIGAETKKRIIDLAKSMDYIPNPLALGLLKNRSFTVGVVVPHIGYYYNSSAISGMEEVLDRHGYSVMICQSNESEEQEKVHVKNLIPPGLMALLPLLQNQLRIFHIFFTHRKRVFLLFFLIGCQNTTIFPRSSLTMKLQPLRQWNI